MCTSYRSLFGLVFGKFGGQANTLNTLSCCFKEAILLKEATAIRENHMKLWSGIIGLEHCLGVGGKCQSNIHIKCNSEDLATLFHCSIIQFWHLYSYCRCFLVLDRGQYGHPKQSTATQSHTQPAAVHCSKTFLSLTFFPGFIILELTVYSIGDRKYTRSRAFDVRNKNTR